ncbi:MAG: ABC transporter ATP-binding protein [Oligoflexia bacterium]|nr:ABC transporter ATP-binding protein [Oligoflexia bacterium]
MQIEKVIEISNLSFSYDSKNIVLKDVNLLVEEKEFLGIIGPNGGGKSTLLKLILGSLAPTNGVIKVLSEKPQKMSKYIGYVPQFATLMRDFPISVLDTVLMGRLNERGIFQNYSKKDKEIALEKLEMLEIADLRERAIGELSGGQLQRALIARALASNPKILLLDEPTSGLDFRIEANLFDLLKKLNNDITVIVVSHDVAFISHYIKRVACVYQNLICHQTSELNGMDIHKLYGHTMHIIPHQH